LAELHGEASVQIREIQREFDPKLAANPTRPHVTVSGSSGVGPMAAGTSMAELRRALEPVAALTPAMELEFGKPTRFMQTNIVVLPLDPYGPLRLLHDRIATSGLHFERPRFTFSPHVTLSLYPTLPDDAVKRLLARRVELPALLLSISVYRTHDPSRSKKLLELPLAGPIR
jgi:2'-5' RNA ligase